MKIYAIRTFYPHWSIHSGYNRLLEYYSQQVEWVEKAVAMGDSRGSEINVFRRFIMRLLAKHVPKSYDFNDLVAEMRLFLYWLVCKVDVVHYMDGEHGIGFFPDMADMVPFKNKPLIVATYHQPVDILSKLVNRRILNSIDLIIVLCESQRKYLSTLVPVEKVHIIYHGVDNEYFHGVTKTYSSGMPIKCLSVGSWLRDYETILKTAELVKGHNIEFHIVNQAMSGDVDSNIYLYKDLTDAELLRLYQESDILFLPFKDATANNVVIEGMACGLAVMSNNIDSIKEYLGDNAQLVLDNQPELFANKLLDISSKPEILEFLSLKSIERAEELSWKNIANECEQLLLSSLRKSGN